MTTSDRYYPLDDALAREAHRVNCFSDYVSDEPDYRAKVDEAYALAKEAGDIDPDRRQEALALADRFARAYGKWLNEGYRINAMCPSIMIAGPANFPVKKKERQNAARERHYKELPKINAIIDKIKRIGDENALIRSGDPKAIQKLEEKLKHLEERHQQMKDANAASRKLGGPTPYAPYDLSSSRARIKRTRARIERLKAEKASDVEDRTITINGEECRVVENSDIMRLQIIFDDIPTKETRELLMKSAFKWSRKNQAWQRQLTDNARRAVRHLKDAS